MTNEHAYYRISQKATGVELYMGQAASVEEALDDYAEVAGSANYYTLIRDVIYPSEDVDEDPGYWIEKAKDQLVIERAVINPDSIWVAVTTRCE